MKQRNNRLIQTMVGILIGSLILSALLSPIQAANLDTVEGYDKGLSYLPVVPLKKVTFVNFDDESYIDDYAYLASLPTAVFSDGEQLYSYPLLYYQDPLQSDEEKEITLDARQGIDYFMEDWMEYCNGQLDGLTLINVPPSDLDPSWKSRETVSIEGNDPYLLASKLALSDWSYADQAVIAVIQEDFMEPNFSLSNTLHGQLDSEDINTQVSFNLEQTNSLNPVYHEFTINTDYKYVKAEAWWDGLLLLGSVMIPTGDPDIQLYCKKDGDWMQTAAAAAWNVYSPPGHEYTHSYVYSPGDWRVGITDFPTEGDAPRKSILGGLLTIQGSLLELLKPTVTYHVDVTMYPGITLEIPDEPPFGCGMAEFTLNWDNPNVDLGFTIIGPGGEAVYTEINESKTDTLTIQLEGLGECLPGEHYSVCVFSLDSLSTPVDFTVDYTMKQTTSKDLAASLTSATEAAVLASQLNAPLLYVEPSQIPEETLQTLYRLGVKNLYIVDIDNRLTQQAFQELDPFSPDTYYSTCRQLYNAMDNLTGSNDVVFSTLDPWTYWYLEELKPAGEKQGALFLGPAAYIAAHHGSPVIILENHPRLSSAVLWHDEFWRRFSSERYAYTPSVAEMVLTGRRIYEFLDDFGFDQQGEETIITVADQYDIGISWDRIFPGVGNSGRFCGSPVDTSYWISRSVFYPVLIFENPALTGTQTMINGSISSREGIRGLLKAPFLNTLAIQRATEEVDVEFPVLCSFVTHKYRFNERASIYYGSKYQCADGLIPGETATMEPIDQGVNLKHLGVEGSYFPDISETEIVPFYLEKGGFDPVFSTAIEPVRTNLNNGVILWVHASHGLHKEGGKTLFWDPQTGFADHPLAGLVAGSKKESNPWRGYDWYFGSTEEPDTMSMDIKGIIPFTNYNPLIFPMPATGMDWVLARKPLREFVNRIILPNRPNFPFPNIDNLYDGLTGTLSFSKYPLAWKNAQEIEQGLGNLHSLGFITSICQTSNTYLHLMMIRHGSVFQVQDPWPTSWYGAVWRQSIPRDIILGYTVGEAYARGIAHVGTLYLADPPQWWWDTMENVVYFGDPDLRMYVPDTAYSDQNHWRQDDTEPLRYDATILIDGHAPYGPMWYPNETQPPTFLQEFFWIIIAFITIAVLIVIALVFNRKQS
jgi:hypothetical protein